MNGRNSRKKFIIGQNQRQHTGSSEASSKSSISNCSSSCSSCSSSRTFRQDFVSNEAVGQSCTLLSFVFQGLELKGGGCEVLFIVWC